MADNQCLLAPLPNPSAYLCLCCQEDENPALYGQLTNSLHSGDYISLPLVSRIDGRNCYLYSEYPVPDIQDVTIGKIAVLPSFYSKDAEERKVAVADIEAQVSWAMHLNFHWLVFPEFESETIMDYARLVRDTFNRFPMLNILVPVNSSMQSWSDFQHVKQISQVVTLRPLLHMIEDDVDETIIGRWMAEGCKHFKLTANDFQLLNGRMEITPNVQKYLTPMLQNCLVFLDGVRVTQEPLHEYRVSIIRQAHQAIPPESLTENIKAQYADTLQSPLQPLRDNLSDQIYTLFMKDPIKYIKYTEAVKIRVRELIDQDFNDTLIIFVVGAGAHGPLVDSSLEALDIWDKPYHIFAVEKNPNAVVMLNIKKRDVWGDRVTIIDSDMRDAQIDVQADIIISELLGSFGCNELSPECLDGVQRYLKPDGISIPTNYTSWASPISTTTIYNMLSDTTMLETPWLCWIETQWILGEAKKLWDFDHPNPRINEADCNDREGTLSWTIEHEAVCHGFAGYFHCVLYKDAHLSIVPETHSPEMISWFPMFFPLKNTVHLKAGDEVTLHMWRKSNRSDVWYEWTISEPRLMHLHNPEGASCKVAKF